MSQEIWNVIDPTTTSGTELADLLNSFKDAVTSGFSGSTARPVNLQENGYWVKYNDPDDGILTLYLYDGTNDIELFKINKTTASIILSNSENEINIIKTTDDAYGPLLNLIKARTTGTQTNAGDTLGEINFEGKDGNGVNFTHATIKAISTENTTDTAHGGKIAFLVAETGNNVLVEAVRIEASGLKSDNHILLENTKETSLGNALELTKERPTTGHIVTGDTLGNVVFKAQGTISSNIRAEATDDSKASKIIFERIKVGGSSLSQAISIEDTIKLLDNTNVSADFSVSGASTLDSLTVTNDAIINGDLTVNGTTTTVNSTDLDVADTNITVNKGGNDTTAEGAGITVERASTDGCIIYDDSADSKFKVGASGSEKEIATVDGTQTITNKTISSNTITNNTITNNTIDNNNITNASITSTSQLEPRKDTFANLETYATTAADGELVYATDEKKLFRITDGELKEAGGGIGSPDLYGFLRQVDTKVNKWNTTNITNATFTANTDDYYMLTNKTSSLNEKIISPTIDIPKRAQSRENRVFFVYKYNGDDGDIIVRIKDNNGTVLNERPLKSKGYLVDYQMFYFVSDTATSVTLEFEIAIENDGKELIFNDVEFNSRDFEVRNNTISHIVNIHNGNISQDANNYIIINGLNVERKTERDLFYVDNSGSYSKVIVKEDNTNLNAMMNVNGPSSDFSIEIGFNKDGSQTHISELIHDTGNIKSGDVILNAGDYIYFKMGASKENVDDNQIHITAYKQQEELVTEIENCLHSAVYLATSTRVGSLGSVLFNSPSFETKTGRELFTHDTSAGYSKFIANEDIMVFGSMTAWDGDFVTAVWFDLAGTRRHLAQEPTADDRKNLGFNKLIKKGERIEVTASADLNLSNNNLYFENNLQLVAYPIHSKIKGAFPTPVVVKARTSSGQTIPVSQDPRTPLNFETIEVDNYNAIQSTTPFIFVAPKTAHYKVNAKLRVVSSSDWATNSPPSYVRLTIQAYDKNDTLKLQDAGVNYGTGTSTSQSAFSEAIVHLEQGEKIKICCDTLHNATNTVSTYEEYNSVSIHEVRY